MQYRWLVAVALALASIGIGLRPQEWAAASPSAPAYVPKHTRPQAVPTGND